MVDNTMLMDLMDAYLTECEIRKLAPKTIEGYKKLLRAMLLWLSDNEQVERLSDLTPMHYKRYLLHKEKDGASPQYINDILRVMRTFSRFLYDEGYTPKLLTEKIKNVKQPKVKIVSFTEEEIQGMLNYYKGNSFLEVRNRAMIAMFFDTGIRCDELIYMQPEQVQSGFIIINGKGSKQRVVPLSPILAKALLKYDQTKKRYFRKKLPASNLFLSKNGRRLSNEAIRLVLIEAAKAVGVRNTVRVSPHTCRHTFAHTQLRNGCDVYTLSRLLGHESISITQRYLDGIQDEQVLRAGLLFSPLMNIKSKYGS